MLKVCVITGTRADYGLLRWVIDGIDQSPLLSLQLVATGMHLSPEFGLTINDIHADGYIVDRDVEMLLSSDTSVGITKSMGLGIIGFADVFSELNPDLVLILGDRFEVLCAAVASLIAKVPVAHLHGGETTQGAIDDSIRHSITKMSHIHFVASNSYRNRVIQLGEQPDHVYCVGGLGIDNINRLQLCDREQLQESLGFKFQTTNLLITFHPVTLSESSSYDQMSDLLSVLAEFRDTGLIFTMPNADTDSRSIFALIDEFCRHHKFAKSFTSLGQIRYLSCMKYVDGVVGNSSSGLLEAPSFKVGTVNIGDRQLGRLCAPSVINCGYDSNSIRSALHQLFSPDFKELLDIAINPYGDGGASEAVVRVLEHLSVEGLTNKKFFDLPS